MNINMSMNTSIQTGADDTHPYKIGQSDSGVDKKRKYNKSSNHKRFVGSLGADLANLRVFHHPTAMGK